MTLTEDKRVFIGQGSGVVSDNIPDTEDLSYGGLTVSPTNPFAAQDYQVIITMFEVECANWAEEDYAYAYHYKDVYATHQFSQRVREQMNYYPGMHQQGSNIPGVDPFYKYAKQMGDERLGYWNAAMDNPDAFMSGLHSKQKDFDYTKIFGSDVSAKTRAEHIGKMITECVPCFDRLFDGAQLLPDADLLEIHMLNIQLRTDLLDKLKSLLQDPGFNIDICELLKMLSHLCPQDLLAILALLTQYLAKLNLDIKFNIDFILSLVGPILSPFLDALSEWLDKWIQMILAPILCVVDHINETIYIAQQAKIPFSEVGINIEPDIGVALPFHQNADGVFGLGANAGLGDSTKNAFQDGAYDPDAGTWGSAQLSQFETPDAQKYNPQVPQPPAEETEAAMVEIEEAWSPSMTDAEREEQNKKWDELKKKHYNKVHYPPAPLAPSRHDGTRWSKDDYPESERWSAGGSFGEKPNHHPPEQQITPSNADEYYIDAGPLVNSIVQMRNIIQGAIQYIKDWFEYVTQMIYDLLGTDFGWMNKKADQTMLKSKIIRLIYMVKAIIEAVSKNGLECGTHSNFDEGQLQFVLEEGMGKFSPYTFRVQPDGAILMDPIVKTQLDVPPESLADPPKEEGVPKQKSIESGIIIKNCLKSVKRDDLAKAREWIADFEKKGGLNV